MPAPVTPWPRLQRQLSENWTGILGVVVLVAGLTFVMVNLALRLGPLARFALTLLLGGGLIVPSLLGRSPSRWRPLSLWLRSGGAALVLFACVAGGSLPELGLRWLEDPAQALALVLAGMAVNLTLAAASRRQTVASLHVLVNLVPLALVGQGALTLAIASLVCLGGQLLPRGRSWDRHRLLLVLGYGLFQISWLLRCLPLVAADPAWSGGVVVAAVLVQGSGIVLPQLGPGLARRLNPMALAVQIAGWTGIALPLLLVPQAAALRAGGLLVAAAAAALLALRARRATLADVPGLAPGGRWLQLSHTLIAQALVVAALLSLRPLLLDGLLLSAVLLVESALFLALGILEREPVIRRVGWLLLVLLAAVMVLQGMALSVAVASGGLAERLRPGGLLIGGSALVATAAALLSQRSVPVPLPPLPGWLAAALMFEGTVMVAPAPWRPLLALAGLGALLLVERRFQPPGLGRASALAVGGVHLAAWLWMLQGSHAPAVLLGQLLPLPALALLTRASAPAGRRRGPALALVSVSVGLGAQLLLAPVSPLLPRVAWLLLSLPALALSERLRSSEVDHGLAVALGYLGAFLWSDLVVGGGSDVRWDLFGLALPARLLMALLGVAVLLGWWCHRPGPALRRSRLWRALHPWFVEFVLLGATVTVLREVRVELRPLSLSFLALLLLSGPVRRWFAPRVRLYAVFTYWLAILATLDRLGAAQAPDLPWPVQPATLSLAAILLQVLFVALSGRWLPAADLLHPGGWPLLASIGRPLARHTQRWLCYPLFVAVALHLAHRHDHAALTLLWGLEAFVIAALSVVLRDGQFRLVALLALGACLVRLLAIDMAQADLGLRGLVFIGVGLLMLAINALYTRFRDRFR